MLWWPSPKYSAEHKPNLMLWSVVHVSPLSLTLHGSLTCALSSKKYFVGDKMTIADCVLASWAYSTYLNDQCQTQREHKAVVEKYPELDAYFKGMGEELKEHLATRISSPW